MNISQRLERLRKNKGISKAELCRQINVPQTTYSGYARGVREPDLHMLEIFSNYYGVSVDYLVTGKEGSKVLQTVDEVVDMYFNLKESDQKVIEELIRRMAEK